MLKIKGGKMEPTSLNRLTEVARESTWETLKILIEEKI